MGRQRSGSFAAGGATKLRLVEREGFFRPAIAELVHRVVQDRDLRAAVVAGQRARLRAFDADAIGAALREHLETLAGAGAVR